ncbi:hypothetical protein [Terrarubrum flagellatum]|uniref:hypothetical protein n=1 Tax=Terrirubrum flagellatum TaxID=2895980 RepID=UPI003144DFA1
MHCLFVIFDAPDVALDAKAIKEISSAIARLPGLAHGRVMTPDRTAADQPFAQDGAGPALALQLYFRSLETAEASAAAGGGLDAFSRSAALQPLGKAAVSHEIMEVRAFDPGAGAPSQPCCTFLVTYPGTTADRAGWLDHYDAHHPPIMKRFPGIREVETYRPVAWRSGLAWARSAVLQRNKVVFNSFAELIAALASPVMVEMRADGRAFPPFTGKATHFPMATWRIEPA